MKMRGLLRARHRWRERDDATKKRDDARKKRDDVREKRDDARKKRDDARKRGREKKTEERRREEKRLTRMFRPPNSRKDALSMQWCSDEKGKKTGE
jgi:hypothetical protein